MTRYRKSKNDIINTGDALVDLTELNSEDYKVFLKFTERNLNNIIGMILNIDKPYINFKVLQNIYNLFKRIDQKAYEMDDKLKYRFLFIKKILHHIVIEDKTALNKNSLLIYIDEHFRGNNYANILSNLEIYSDLDEKTINAINIMIQDRLNYIHLLTYKNAIISLYDNLIANNFQSYKEINDKLKGVLTAMLSKMKRVDTLTDSIKSLSLEDGFDEVVLESVQKLRDKSRVLKTGIKQLNKMLSPGYMGGMIYCYLGVPNGGKTLVLVKSLLDIKKYNHGALTKNPGYRPTILFVTMEDTVVRLVGRIYSMLVSENKLMDESVTPQIILEQLRNEGGMNLETTDINIEIKYFDNRTIDTSDLYGIIEEMKDEKKEVIALVLDYLKRIKPAEYAKEERDELKNITNELRSLAISYDIPVITAHQLNRSALEVVSKAAEGMDNVTGKLTGAQIGGSFAIIENCDLIIIINRETDDTGKQYMVFKKIKIRYKDDYDVNQIAHPFSGDKGRLLDDIDLPGNETLSIDMVTKSGSKLKDYVKPVNNNEVIEYSAASEDSAASLFLTNNSINVKV